MTREERIILDAVRDHLEVCTGEDCHISMTSLCMLVLEKEEPRNNIKRGSN